MLFNSFEFILFFIPVVWIVYFLLNRFKLLVLAKCWLVASSLFFYGWWNVIYVPLISISILVNYTFGYYLREITAPTKRKTLIISSILFNVALLGYFKYADFFIGNSNLLFGTTFNLLEIALPLAISFFTFQQIAFLVDVYRKESVGKDFLDYSLFVLFFPQLIAGPIVNHQEMMPQFHRLRQKIIHYPHLAQGIYLFSIGLFKKVMIADTFAVWVNTGFSDVGSLSFFEAWICGISFYFQLYFDFSGYMDMAMGAALLFNIRLPMNFNSPYKAKNISEFWQRWHITLTRFLNKYVFTLWLGASRGSRQTMYVKILLVFLISGLWHGASWNFVFWGFLHGIALLIHRYWKSFHIKMNGILAWFITTYFIFVSGVFFRLETWDEAITVFLALHGFQGFSMVDVQFFRQFQSFFDSLGIPFESFFLSNADVRKSFLYIVCAFVIVLFTPNSHELQKRFIPNFKTALFTLLLLSICFVNLTKVSDFLYFNF